MTILARRKLLSELRDLDAYLADVVAKNCGTGPGGFQPGNTCASARHRNSAAGSKRRRRAGKRRRNRGPNTGIGARTRAVRRQKRGTQRQAQREWELRSEKPSATDSHTELADEHLAARIDLADTIRAEREDLHDSIRTARDEQAQSIRRERAENELDRRRDRISARRRQQRETASLEAAQGRQLARLEAYHARQLSRTRHPERLAARQQADRERIAEQHRDGLEDQRETHASERAELRQDQRDARESDREGWRAEIENRNDEDRSERFDKHREWREQIHELRQNQRRERLEFEREARREERAERGKSYSWDVKATPGDDVPGAQAILTNALVATGHTEAWEAETLSDEQRRELLEAVVTEGKAWFRSTAESLIADIGETTEKALFGAAKAKVGAFFARAKKHVRELFTAGVLAVTGPGPANPQDAIVQATQQQVSEQIQYLDRFHGQIVAEDKPLDKTFVTRAEMYGAAAHGATIEAQRQAHIAAGLITEARRILGPAEEHCPECPVLASRGWVPIKRAVPIGRTVCRVNCRCWMEFR